MSEWKMKRPVSLENIPSPTPDADIPVMLTDETMKERKAKVLEAMKRTDTDTLIFWCDLEHGSNFEYLTGFETRFEESLLVLQADGEACMILGNENLKMAKHSRIEARLIHCPFFSLPNQPMAGESDLTEVFRSAGVKPASRIGIVGWKLFTSAFRDNKALFDLPEYIMDAIREAAPESTITNMTDLMIGRGGVRETNNANEIAHYEFGSALASDCVIRTMNRIVPGIDELDLADTMNAKGQRCNVVTICAGGQRYEYANFYPRSRALKIGDPVSLTCGYKGGLASRAGFVVDSPSQLPESQQDYVEKVVKPYFGAVCAWLETIKIGMTGGEMYELIDTVLPKKDYNWLLCPGHLTADEEWLSSPIYENSTEPLVSGMLLQIDIIPSVPGYNGTGCENGVLLADKNLADSITAEYPELMERMLARKQYIRDFIGIRLPDEVFPLSSGVGYLRPNMADHGKAMTCR